MGPVEFDQKDKDFFFVGARDAEDLVERLSDLVCNRLPKAYGFDPKTDIQVISPMKKSTAGVNQLNAVLQQALNPPQKAKREHVTALRVFREGDKVMQVKNNYDLPWEAVSGNAEGVGVYNGDIGLIESIEPDCITVIFDGERKVEYKPSMLEELELAYAVTVHKSQGSEFDAVVMPVFSGVPQLTYRNLLYTAVTRAKSLLILVGSGETVRRMVENDRKTLRYTGLRRFLTQTEVTVPWA